MRFRLMRHVECSPVFREKQIAMHAMYSCRKGLSTRLSKRRCLGSVAPGQFASRPLRPLPSFPHPPLGHIPSEYRTGTSQCESSGTCVRNTHPASRPRSSRIRQPCSFLKPEDCAALQVQSTGLACAGRQRPWMPFALGSSKLCAKTGLPKTSRCPSSTTQPWPASTKPSTRRASSYRRLSAIRSSD